MLDDLSVASQSEPYAIAPTQFEEEKLGYDVALRAQKILFFQYKRASARKRFWSYPTSTHQLLSLILHSGGPKRAYYALPQLWTERDLRGVLPPPTDRYFDRITFLDVWQIPLWTKRIRYENGEWWSRGHGLKVALSPERWAPIFWDIVSCDAGLPLWERLDGDEIEYTLNGREYLERRSRLRELTSEIGSRLQSSNESNLLQLSVQFAETLLRLIPSREVEAESRARQLVISSVAEELFGSLRLAKSPDLVNWGLARTQLFSFFRA